jgi:TatD DNase family protein
MFIDSHCHLDFPEFQTRLPEVLANMADAKVQNALCVSVDLPDFPKVLKLAEDHSHLYASVGVHPDYENTPEPTFEFLVQTAKHPKIIAIGETGLDYYQMAERKGGRSVLDMEWQRDRFRTHIRAARQLQLPLVIHTRSATEDTLRILKEEGETGGEGSVGGVFHCFTESKEVAKAALDFGFYISFSGILTFKTASELREVASWVPLDRLLIETDSPYLAPVPYRGKTNKPSYVPFVAKLLGELRGTTPEVIGQITSDNFDRLFHKIHAG